MPKSIVTTALVKQAFDMVSPHIAQMLKDHARPQDTGAQSDLSVVVSATEVINPHNPDKSFKDNCLLVTEFGDKTTWEIDIESIALSKAEKSVRTGISSVNVEPHYFYEGDTPYWGSVVLDGIVVACSGVESHYDEMFAMWIASAIKALCKKQISELPQGQHFI